ncbi:MAG: septum formation initiator family protein [Clostridia bacterium]|nr:septum formation initiator family protein [Clostridia bacterium]
MKKTARLNFFIKLTIVVVICFCAVNIIRLRGEYNQLRDREKELLEEKEKYEDAIYQIQQDLERDMDEEYIMRIAREKLNYYLPDEIIFFNDR